MDEQGPEDSWEDHVLVDPGLKSPGEPRLVMKHAVVCGNNLYSITIQDSLVKIPLCT